MLRTGGAGTADPENWYVAGFVARRLLSSWAPVRLPFSSFRNVDPLGEPLDPAKVNRMARGGPARGARPFLCAARSLALFAAPWRPPPLS